MLKSKPDPVIPLDLAGPRQLPTGPVWFSSASSPPTLPPPNLHSSQDVLSSWTLPRTVTQSISFLLLRSLLSSAPTSVLPGKLLTGLQISSQITSHCPGMRWGLPTICSHTPPFSILYCTYCTGVRLAWLLDKRQFPPLKWKLREVKDYINFLRLP